MKLWSSIVWKVSLRFRCKAAGFGNWVDTGVECRMKDTGRISSLGDGGDDANIVTEEGNIGGR